MNPFAMITSLYELEHGINGSILLLEMMEVVSIILVTLGGVKYQRKTLLCINCDTIGMSQRIVLNQ